MALSFFTHQLPFIVRLIGLMKDMNKRKDSAFNMTEGLEQRAKTTPDKLALIDAEGIEPSLTWAQWDEMANRIANWGKSIGLKHRDVVALYMENRPIYPVVWTGLAKIGVTTALINHSQEGKALTHSITESKAKHIIVDGDKTAATDAIRDAFPNLDWFTFGGDEKVDGYTSLSDILETMPTDRPPPPAEGHATDPLVLVYTSGTTGLPKATIITHLRFFGAGNIFSRLGKVTDKDVIYTSLPLYHSAGGMIGVGSLLAKGATLVIRRRFSASNFIPDCVKHDCTVAQYIGEILRYVISIPPADTDRQHKLRFFLGNGLRPDIWEDVVNRFGCRVFEFYGATEGNVTLVNPHGQARAVGYMPPLLQKLLPYKIVKFDVNEEIPARNASGFCQMVKPGEVGEAIGEIRHDDPVTEFRGYTSDKATQKKIIRDVFQKGDAYFLTGDLLRMDKEGYCYFVDRIGDTFRWKGENVATTEVSEIINSVPGVEESIVYGVSIPGHDGRAGMASLILNNQFELEALASTLETELPHYARPLFLRILPEPDLTGTFKHQKARLKAEGFAIDLGDDIYIHSAQEKKYVRLTQDQLDIVSSGKNTRL